eukprot:CAMPEP_0115020588 /NCGR_PEP_ID=MMETSP0216-20121206/30266_1 /TAXON_ID=223996 /ORGANISM="Protocruzia adherens, Strain Boccale" /LENGTH=305 /DNA_ID=CAMNT_0002392553 /DNA_START=48 /DNA_END=962 /DNA_ORIENTATION=-
MELNSILFPAPQPSYSSETLYREILWIPKEEEKSEDIDSTTSQSSSISTTSKKKSELAHIPCLYLPYHRGSSKILIYFHGNAEDIGLAYDLLDHLRNALMVHVIAMEYPGYGVYAGSPSATKISEDAEHLYRYLTKTLLWSEKNIMLFGRSIGSGPATLLANKFNPGALLLMSAYTSIKQVVKHLAGKVATVLVAERFKNIDLMEQVSCPTFFVHGQQDTLIPYTHSQELFGLCGGPCELILPQEMDHNEFDFFDDLSLPFSRFLAGCGVAIAPENEKEDFLDINEELFKVPDALPSQNKNKSVW